MKFKAKNLNYRYIRCTSKTYDWSTGYGEAWDVVLPSTDDMKRKACKEWLIEYGIDFDKDETKENLRDRVSEAFQDNMHEFEPMMNFWIDLDDNCRSHAEIANAVVGTCFTAVTVDGRIGVALTGGGMDMTWQIIQAFAALGSLPPFQYCRVPDMAGYKDGQVIKAANRTIEAIMADCTRTIEHNSKIKGA